MSHTVQYAMNMLLWWDDGYHTSGLECSIILDRQFYLRILPAVMKLWAANCCKTLLWWECLSIMDVNDSVMQWNLQW